MPQTKTVSLIPFLVVLAACGSAAPVDVETYAEIGGIRQWITIHGDDEANPVLLFVHGGPGGAFSPFSRAVFGDWESSFTIAQWDQPGAGRTFGQTGEEIAATLTIDRVISDGIEVTEEILERTGKKKLILLGGSWGSVIGMEMVSRRPDLFFCYVGVGQLIGSQAAYRETYATLVSWVSDALDADELEQLRRIGPPPWTSLRSFGLMTRIARSFEEQRAEPDRPLGELWANDYSEDDKAVWHEGNEFSQVHFFGLNLDGELPKVDLAATVTKVDIPVFVFQGAEDIRTPADLVQQFLDGLNAPRKELVLLEGGGHDLEFQINDTLRAQMESRVRPLAMDQE